MSKELTANRRKLKNFSPACTRKRPPPKGVAFVFVEDRRKRAKLMEVAHEAVAHVQFALWEGRNPLLFG